MLKLDNTTSKCSKYQNS